MKANGSINNKLFTSTRVLLLMVLLLFMANCQKASLPNSIILPEENTGSVQAIVPTVILDKPIKKYGDDNVFLFPVSAIKLNKRSSIGVVIKVIDEDGIKHFNTISIVVENVKNDIAEITLHDNAAKNDLLVTGDVFLDNMPESLQALNQIDHEDTKKRFIKYRSSNIE